MEEKFRTIVEHIFHNWTGFQLAVEHEMGGPQSQQTALECVDYMTKYCLYEPNAQASDIKEALEDIMDEEFDTICEDNSPAEVANALYRFSQLLKEGNVTQCDLEYQDLPNSKAVLKSQPPGKRIEETGEQSAEVPMEEDSEWTEVKSRRRK